MIPRVVSFILVFLHFGHIFTKVGRSFLFLVIDKYIDYFFATFGIWKTNRLWKSQNIEENLARVSVNDVSSDLSKDESNITEAGLTQAIPRRQEATRLHHLSSSGNTFVSLENQITMIQFLHSMMSSKAVLWQLIPVVGNKYTTMI